MKPKKITKRAETGSFLNRFTRKRDEILNPMRLSAHECKKEATDSLVHLMGKGSDMSESTYPFTQEATVLSRKTLPRIFAAVTLYCPPICIPEVQLLNSIKQKRQSNKYEKFNSETSNFPKELILTRNQIDRNVERFKKYLRKDYEVDEATVNQYGDTLKDKLLEESNEALSVVNGGLKIKSNTAELV